jgi:amidohydrolase
MRKTRFNGLGIVLFLVILTFLWAATAVSDEKQLLAAIDERAGSCRAVSQKILDYKELGQQEFKSCQLLMEELRKLGFKVEGDLKVPDDLIKGGVAKTAFRAELAGKGPGPTITIMLEYNALPNGHSCGHNLISTSGLLAAAGPAKLMKDTPGRLLIIGTPDEDRGSFDGGKISLLEGKHFDGTDMVLITHPGDVWSVDKELLAMKRATFVFKGKAAHAAAAPEQGINALDAAIQTFNGINALRQHLRQDVRIHGIIKKGGEAVNVVPALAEAEFAARAYPTVNIMFKIAPEGVALHADEMLKYTVPEAGWQATVQAAKAVALTAYDLLKNPAKEKKIQEKFRQLKAKEGK